MKEHFERNAAVYVIATIILIFIFAVVNGVYCLVNYWNVPYIEVPMQCHLGNRN